MAEEKVICNKSTLVDIANAIRAITGSTETYYPAEIASQVTLSQLSSLSATHDGAGNVTLTINKE